jgi:large subunit ribosomal protein L15
MDLGSLIAPVGARKKRKRVGRGTGSGHGKTSTRGHKGQKARAGGYHKRGFEGGQMPLVRRVPKFGFVNPFRKTFEIVNVGRLSALPAGTVITESFLKEKGFVKGRLNGIKLLGEGDLKTSLTIDLPYLSASARKKIEAAGGKVLESSAAGSKGK